MSQNFICASVQVIVQGRFQIYAELIFLSSMNIFHKQLSTSSWCMKSNLYIDFYLEEFYEKEINFYIFELVYFFKF